MRVECKVYHVVLAFFSNGVDACRKSCKPPEQCCAQHCVAHEISSAQADFLVQFVTKNRLTDAYGGHAEVVLAVGMQWKTVS